MVSVPVDLSRSRELRTLSTSSSDMFIENKFCLTEVSTLKSLFADIKLPVENDDIIAHFMATVHAFHYYALPYTQVSSIKNILFA